MGLNGLPKQFQHLGLRMPATPKHRRLVLCTEGYWGTGKSNLIFDTCPKPLLQINLDMGTEGIEERYIGEDIYIYDVYMPGKINQELDLKQFFKIRQMIFDGFDTEYFRTIAVDTGDAMWELCRRGFLGTVDFGDVNQSQYAEANGAMRRIYKAAKEQKRVNFIVTHRLTDERKDSVSAKTGKKSSVLTGNDIMAGWKWTKYEAQCFIRLEKVTGFVCDKPACHKHCQDPDEHRLNRFTATITKCTANERCEGEVLRGREITLANIGVLVFPKTFDTPEVWL